MVSAWRGPADGCTPGALRPGQGREALPAGSRRRYGDRVRALPGVARRDAERTVRARAAEPAVQRRYGP